jgi:integrase
MKRVTLAMKAPKTATYRERLEIAIAEAKELNAELALRRRRAAALDPKTVPGTIPWLISECRQKNQNYIGLEESTKERTYECWFRLLEQWSLINGHPDVRLLTTPIIQQLYEEIVSPDPDTGDRTLAKGRNVISTLSMLMGYAKVRLEGLASNPADGVIMARKTKRVVFWTLDQMQKAKRTALQIGLSSIALSVDLAYDLGQRRGDLVSLKVSQWDGRTFAIVQEKTNQSIKVPAIESLRRQMEELLRRRNPAPDDCVLVDDDGKPYTGDSFYDAFQDVVQRAGLTDLWFHDLRRTCVVRLARAGLSIPQISAITGHTLKSASTILETYLPRDETVAAEGIKKLEEYEAKVASEK